MVNYQELNQSLRALIHGVPHQTANLANASALLYMTLDRIKFEKAIKKKISTEEGEA